MAIGKKGKKMERKTMEMGEHSTRFCLQAEPSESKPCVYPWVGRCAVLFPVTERAIQREKQKPQARAGSYGLDRKWMGVRDRV